ncbi:hypothetical protein ACFX1S_035233 [Malus domestica]
MPDIALEIACHKLHVNPAAKQVIQKRRHFSPKQVAIIEDEIDKLLEAEFIKKVAHSTWLANIVLVKKKRRQMEGFRILHRPQQSMPKGSLSTSPESIY